MLQLFGGRSHAGPGLFTQGARAPPHGLEDIEANTLLRPAPLELVPPELEGASGLLAGLLEKDMESRTSTFLALQHPWLCASVSREPGESEDEEHAQGERARGLGHDSPPSNGQGRGCKASH